MAPKGRRLKIYVDVFFKNDYLKNNLGAVESTQIEEEEESENEDVEDKEFRSFAANVALHDWLV